MTSPILVADGLGMSFERHRSGRARTTEAVVDASFALHVGETLGLVGESGCGKSTLARILVLLTRPTAGKVLFDGVDVTQASGDALTNFRRSVQLVFQDSQLSLNPRRTVGAIIGEPLIVNGRRRDRQAYRRRISELLELVGLSMAQVTRFPHELSGGQRQRVGIARALALHPRVLIADEPVSALDVSVQAQILNLLAELQREFSLALLLISHDLAVVRQIADRVAVMYAGRIVESGGAEQIYCSPAHPYTADLLRAAPRPEPGRRGRLLAEGGLVAEEFNPTDACPYFSRCSRGELRCRRTDPESSVVASGHIVTCNFPL